jgi:murein DD-endopeptidase MepM/ murein hydrolase activator NlpD
MRSSLTRGMFAKALLTVAAAAVLAGCSNSIERFSAAYDNPSDADPVYTASVPKARKVTKPALKKPRFEEPRYEAAEEIIEETPVRRAAIPFNKPKDYASAYKQPVLTAKKPRLVPAPEDVAEEVQDEYVAPVAVKAPFKKAKPAAPKLVAPETDDDVALVDAPAPKKKIKFNKSTPVVEEDLADVEPVVVKAKPKAKATAGTHTVEQGDTLYSLGRKYGVSPFAISEANAMEREQRLVLGQTLKIPGSKAVKPAVVEDEADVADVAPVTKPVKKKKAPLSLTEEQQADADADGEAAIGEAPAKTGVAVKPKLKAPVEDVAEAPSAPAGLNLRWPLKGKIISGFGNKPGGLKNEGINIAVPEGTSIRAADGGVVAYAGNELKGYGNLVLIRHPGGYVTAYAHAKELFVKRGDKVERGGVIGKAGQTGSVSSPQLHFEVRKGATALDPQKYLASATAAN